MNCVANQLSTAIGLCQEVKAKSSVFHCAKVFCQHGPALFAVSQCAVRGTVDCGGEQGDQHKDDSSEFHCSLTSLLV